MWEKSAGPKCDSECFKALEALQKSYLHLNNKPRKDISFIGPTRNVEGEIIKKIRNLSMGSSRSLKNTTKNGDISLSLYAGSQ